MSYRLLLPALCLTLAATGALAAERQLPGRVLRVIDGDSLVLDVRGGQLQVDLIDLDAPELNQPWGQAAAELLHRTLTGTFVTVGEMDRGQPARGRVLSRGRDVGLDLLYAGLAWSRIAPEQGPGDDRHPYDLAQAQARDARRGVWSDDAPVPPWEWRRGRAVPRR